MKLGPRQAAGIQSGDKSPHSKMPAAIDAVNAVLENYARRGVFTSFVREGSRFRFTWLWNRPFELRFDARQRALVFPAILPKPADIEKEARRFLRSCAAEDRPVHRRIDPERMAVSFTKQKGALTLVCRVRGGDYEHAVRTAINLVNEMFVLFLNTEHPRYLMEQFERPED